MRKSAEKKEEVDIEVFRAEMKTLFAGCIEIYHEYSESPEDNLKEKLNNQLRELIHFKGRGALVKAMLIEQKIEIYNLLNSIIDSDEWKNLAKNRNTIADILAKEVDGIEILLRMDAQTPENIARLVLLKAQKVRRGGL